MQKYAVLFVATVACLCIALNAHGGKLENGILTVDGRPFFPLGGWDYPYTTPEDLSRLGMNTSFRGAPQDPDGIEKFRAHMRECAQRGIQVIPYLSFGAEGVIPWPVEKVRAVSVLAQEPNLLVWYVGDDVGPQHLDGIRQTVTVLREQTAEIPTVADYIAEKIPEAKTVFTKYVDIRCQYEYPLPNAPYSKYLTFFDEQRDFVGDPLWTWIQAFMWGSTGRELNIGAEGPGPVPEPEQVRLLAFAALNRGVRGLLFFAHHTLHRMPELAAEVAWTCREIRVFNDVLAAGDATLNLKTSDPRVNAAAFRYGDVTVLSAAVFGEQYHRWVDTGSVVALSITCPWNGQDLPRAFYVATPELIACSVERTETTGMISITVPRLDLSGFIVLTNNDAEIERVRKEIAQIPNNLGELMSVAAATQTRKVSDVLWRLGIDNLYKGNETSVAAARTTEQCAVASIQGDWVKAFQHWRDVMRLNRGMLDTVMQFAAAREADLTEQERIFLKSPYGLHNLKGFGNMPTASDPWRFVRTFAVIGPFPLEWDGQRSDRIPAGFDKRYPPEIRPLSRKSCHTVDGKTSWQFAQTDLSGCLDFLPFFKTKSNVVAYARCVVVSPRKQTVKVSLGSNDGAKVLVNGKEVFSWCSVPHNGRSARQHQNQFDVELQEGKNVFLAKVENLGANWQLYLALHDPNRELTVTAE